MYINLLKVKKYSLIGLFSVLVFFAGYGASMTTEAEVTACSKDPFVTAVYETVGYASFFTKHELSEQLAKSGLGEADMTKYKKALDFVFDKGYGDPIHAALAQCLNK